MTTLQKDCSICYEPFFFQINPDDSVIDEFNQFMKSDPIKNLKRNKKLQLFYSRLCMPNSQKYICSTPNCGVILCDCCFANNYYRTYSITYNIVYKCSHCRLYDWKHYMTTTVLPDMMCVSLGRMGPPEFRIPFRLVASV